MACITCSHIPTKLPTAGRLFFGIADLRVRARLAKLLRSLGYEVDSREPTALAVAVETEVLPRMFATFTDELAAEDFAGIRVHLSPDSREQFTSATSEKMTPAAEFATRIESEWLISLLEQGSLTSYFQPVIKMQSGEVVGHECLMRAFDSSKHSVSPSRMFSTARELHLVDDLDRMARLTAIRTASHFSGESEYFINFEAHLDEDLSEAIETTLAATMETGLSATKIILEMTGSSSTQDMDWMRKVFDGYRSVGFRIALDDMQPGYRSLQILQELKPDYVKLDMRLTRSIRLDTLRQAIARHLLERSRKEGALTVVKGIETAEEWDWCREHGADFAQGYYYAAPAERPVYESTNANFRLHSYAASLR